MPYDINSRGYAQRARARLDEATYQALFYAAFELRAGIESRLQAYLEHRDDVPKKARIDYRIEPLAGHVSRSFKHALRAEEQVIRLSMYRKDNQLIGIFYYTPVMPSLRKKAEKLGELLHAMQKRKSDDDLWWEDMRRFLEATYSELVEANKGDLLGPPLIWEENGTARIAADVDLHADRLQQARDLVTKGMRVRLSVDYLDRYPGSN